MNQVTILPQVIEVMTRSDFEDYLQQLKEFTKKATGITITQNSIAKALNQKHILIKRGKPRLTPAGLQQIGVNAHEYGLILDNKKQPTCYTVVQLSKLFTIPIDQLITFTFKPF